MIANLVLVERLLCVIFFSELFHSRTPQIFLKNQNALVLFFLCSDLPFPFQHFIEYVGLQRYVHGLT